MMLGVCYIEVTGESRNVFIHLFFSLFKCLEEATPAKLRGHSWQTGGGVGENPMAWQRSNLDQPHVRQTSSLMSYSTGDFSCVILGDE